MAQPKPSRERLIAYATDARIMGNATAAKLWGISDRTGSNYVKQVNGDELLSQRVAERVERTLANVEGEIQKTITSSAIAVRARIATAETEVDAKILSSIGDATKIFGELHVAYATIQAEQQLTLDLETPTEPEAQDLPGLPPAPPEAMAGGDDAPTT